MDSVLFFVVNAAFTPIVICCRVQDLKRDMK
jgi:hypothetical protein